jgi:hypothetical protein
VIEPLQVGGVDRRQDVGRLFHGDTRR